MPRREPGVHEPRSVPWYYAPYVEPQKLSLDELRTAVDHVTIDACTVDQSHDNRPAIMQRAGRLLHELARRGPEYALEHGFAALASVAALLALRRRIRIAEKPRQDLERASEAKRGLEHQ